MTPKRKTATSTTLAIERRAVVNNTNPGSDKVHVAGGDHRGIVINKEVTQGNKVASQFVVLQRRMYTISWNSDDEDQPMVRVEGYKKGVPATCVSWWVVGSSPGNRYSGVTFNGPVLKSKAEQLAELLDNNQEFVYGDNSPAQLSLEFRVFLVSGQTGKHTQESRTLQFWFITNLSESDQASVAQEFFKELVSPQEFPRDYIGFIKKVMKLLQHGYSSLKKVEVTLTQLDEVETPPNRPSVNWYFDITLDLRPDLGECSVSDRSSSAWSAQLPASGRKHY
uniref:Uncharacterized protein n=1 Tax=Timema douglasi TaxID=61478 RepID=A0A7R8Z8J1_TIMDO|nr:unnamed protein product [Timema douglasi]